MYSVGFYDEHLACWRPRGASVFDEVRRFFIGGSAELEDLSYVAIPSMFHRERMMELRNQRTPFSRFGFRTISTGTVHVKLNVVFQSQ